MQLGQRVAVFVLFAESLYAALAFRLRLFYGDAAGDDDAFGFHGFRGILLRHGFRFRDLLLLCDDDVLRLVAHLEFRLRFHVIVLAVHRLVQPFVFRAEGGFFFLHVVGKTLFGSHLCKFLREFRLRFRGFCGCLFRGFLLVFRRFQCLCLDCLRVLCEFRLIVQALLLATDFQFLAEMLLRLGVQHLLFLCGADLGFNPSFASRLARFPLTQPYDALFETDGVFDAHKGEHARKHKSRDGFQSHEEEGEDGVDGFRLVEDDGECAVGVFDDLLYCFGEGGRRVHGLGRDVARSRDPAVEDARDKSRRGGDDDGVGGHRYAVATEAVFPFEVIERVREERHEHICAGESADVFDELSHKDDVDVGGRHPAYRAAEGVEQEAYHRDILLAEFFRERPHREDPYAHRDAAQDGDERLRDAVRVSAEDIVAVVRQGEVFELAGQRIEQEVAEEQQHIFVRQHRLDLGEEGDFLFRLARAFQRDALLGEVIFHERERERDAGEHAHAHDPQTLARAEGGHDRHREYEGDDDAAHHDGADVVEHRQHASLRRVAGGEGHHQVVAHVVDGVGDGIIEVIRQHHPHDLQCLVAARHHEEQDAAHRKQGRRKEQPRTRLALFCAGAVDDEAHHHVGYGVDDLGDDGEYDEECASPHRAQAEDVRIIDVEVGRHDGVEKERAAGAQKVAQPFLFVSDILRGELGVPDAPREESACVCHDLSLVTCFREGKAGAMQIGKTRIFPYACILPPQSVNNLALLFRF